MATTIYISNSIYLAYEMVSTTAMVWNWLIEVIIFDLSKIYFQFWYCGWIYQGDTDNEKATFSKSQRDRIQHNKHGPISCSYFIFGWWIWLPSCHISFWVSFCRAKIQNTDTMSDIRYTGKHLISIVINFKQISNCGLNPI